MRRASWVLVAAFALSILNKLHRTTSKAAMSQDA
jgi:hypothetical protein